MNETQLCTCGHTYKQHRRSFSSKPCAIDLCECFAFTPAAAPQGLPPEAVATQDALERQHKATDDLWNENAELRKAAGAMELELTTLRARVAELENQNRRMASWYSGEQDISEELQTQLTELRAALSAAHSAASAELTRAGVAEAKVSELQATLELTEKMEQQAVSALDAAIADRDEANTAYKATFSWLSKVKLERDEARAERDRAVAAHNELIMAVGKKWPDESRHETALRYIRRAETPSDEQAKAAKGEPK